MSLLQNQHLNYVMDSVTLDKTSCLYLHTFQHRQQHVDMAGCRTSFSRLISTVLSYSRILIVCIQICDGCFSPTCTPPGYGPVILCYQPSCNDCSRQNFVSALKDDNRLATVYRHSNTTSVRFSSYKNCITLICLVWAG